MNKVEELQKRVDTLQAELAAMREQKPVAVVNEGPYSDAGSDGYYYEISERLLIGTKLYAAPVFAPSQVAAEVVPYAEGIAESLERTDWTPEQALRWYADGRHFDTVSGRTRIIDTGSVASNALKHHSLEYLEMKGDAELAELRGTDEVVQVPRELLANFIEYSSVHKDGVQSLWQISKDKLRALLATSQENKP